MGYEEPDGSQASPLDAVLGFQLRRAHMLFAEHWQLGFHNKPLRVTPMQGGMLLSIEDRPGITQTALARLMDVEGPTLLQALDKIEQAGLVQRSRRADDRRSFALHLTQAGAEAVEAIKRFLPHREAELLSDLSAAERALLLDLLRRVARRGRVVMDEAASPDLADRAIRKGAVP